MDNSDKRFLRNMIIWPLIGALLFAAVLYVFPFEMGNKSAKPKLQQSNCVCCEPEKGE